MVLRNGQKIWVPPLLFSFFFLLLIPLSLDCYSSYLHAQSSASGVSTSKLYSQVLDEERTLSIYLPDEYKTSGKAYPVLYVLDAEGPKTFPLCVSTVNELYQKERAPQMIIVGIWNTDRNRDMIPESVSHRPGSGGSENFLAFFNEELIPFIKRTYRTAPDSILYGMSNSALFAVYALFQVPDSFTAYITSSPMLGHCPDFMKDKMESFVERGETGKRILYIIYGTEDTIRVTDFAPAFHEHLKLHAPKGFLSELVILEGEGHVPESSLSRGLQFIFE